MVYMTKILTKICRKAIGGTMRGIILEGQSYAGKSSTLRALKRQHVQAERGEQSIVVLTENYSQICNMIGGELVFLEREEHLRLLQERVEMLEQLNAWTNKLGSDGYEQRGVFFVLERFHLNHRVFWSKDDLRFLAGLEQRLLQLGAKCALLSISPAKASQRIRERNSAKWARWSPAERADKCRRLMQEQQMYREQVQLTCIPTVEVNTDGQDWDLYAAQILNFLAS